MNKPQDPPRKALGKGLSALLPARSTPLPPTAAPAPGQAPPATLTSLPIDLIDPNPLQPRTVFQPDRLRELSLSIEANGIIQPLIVRRKGDRYDLLVDATLRRDPTVPAIPNGWLEVMPEHAVLLDLAADPYDLTTDPPGIKGIEGVPHGSLSQHAFAPDDPAWGRLEGVVDVRVRRVSLSCDAWPGVRPRDSMERYGEQVEAVMEVVLSVPLAAWDRRGTHHRVRAVARAELERWRATHTA